MTPTTETLEHVLTDDVLRHAYHSRYEGQQPNVREVLPKMRDTLVAALTPYLEAIREDERRKVLREVGAELLRILPGLHERAEQQLRDALEGDPR